MTEDAELERRRADVRSGVLAGVAARRARRRALTAAAASGAALLVVAGVAIGATKLVTVAPVVQTGAAACYESADLNSYNRHFSNGDQVPFDVVETCTQFWQYGQLGQTPRVPDNDFSTEYTVPRIAVCLAPDGIPSGFPLEPGTTEYDLCDHLGLPVYKGP